MQVFRRIEEVVVKTCISAEPNMLDLHSKSQEKRTCGFEIYGFDILLDSGLKPWLMEVNVCPSLSSSSPMDRKIKHTLLTDVLNLVGIEHSREEKLRKKAKDKFPHEAIGRKIYSKNIKTIEELSYTNCVEMLSPEDWLLLFELRVLQLAGLLPPVGQLPGLPDAAIEVLADWQMGTWRPLSDGDRPRVARVLEGMVSEASGRRPRS